jgi:hypothetical protein
LGDIEMWRWPDWLQDYFDHDAVAIEAALQSSISALARDLGWDCAINCRLAEVDLPKVTPFRTAQDLDALPVAHRKACLFRFVPGHAVELLINISLLEIGHFPIRLTQAIEPL